jgi:hypothetical protein
MKTGLRLLGGLTVGAVLFSGISLAQTASVTLNRLGNATMDNMPVGPYEVTIAGISTLAISDDYLDTTTPGNMWMAELSSRNDLNGAQWNSVAGLSGYEEAAYLGSELLAAYLSGNQIAEGEIQFAVWGIFDPAALTNLESYNKTYWSAAEAYFAAAVDNPERPFAVFTPVSTSGTELMIVRSRVATAEPGAPLLLGFDIASACAVLFVLRRYAKRHGAV